jgi:hypothetical protein
MGTGWGCRRVWRWILACWQWRQACDQAVMSLASPLQTNLEDTLRQEVSLQDVKSCENEKKCLLNFWATM